MVYLRLFALLKKIYFDGIDGAISREDREAQGAIAEGRSAFIGNRNSFYKGKGGAARASVFSLREEIGLVRGVIPSR